MSEVSERVDELNDTANQRIICPLDVCVGECCDDIELVDAYEILHDHIDQRDHSLGLDEVGGYAVPLDPMELLQCGSCQ
ncbi:hypothetical protein ACPPVW_18510 [Leifsonia sp. McL0607]|uniref:hypothetical protein n=1 Tax=Leifsonia sp. McL0607 TaxID=3415672 RepID=UPI003CF9CBB3